MHRALWPEHGRHGREGRRSGSGKLGLRLCGTWKVRFRLLNFLSPFDSRYPLYKSRYPLYA